MREVMMQSLTWSAVAAPSRQTPSAKQVTHFVVVAGPGAGLKVLPVHAAQALPSALPPDPAGHTANDHSSGQISRWGGVFSTTECTTRSYQAAEANKQLRRVPGNVPATVKNNTIFHVQGT